MSPPSRKTHNPRAIHVLKVLVGSLGFVVILLLHHSFSSTDCEFDNRQQMASSSSLLLPVAKQKYRGVQYWKTGVTQSVRTIYETAFARFQIHSVLLEDGKTVVDDWMWCDEGDHINLLVEKDNSNNNNAGEQPTYLIFRQQKYAMQEETMAIVGGFLDPGESPLEAAKRELKEELNMISTDWISLGSFRAAANRGGGHTHTFLARRAKPIISSSVVARKLQKTGGSFAQGESERQDLLELSREELLEALMAGKFQEIKWTATIALAILKTQME